MKNALRKQMREQRQSLSPVLYAEKSEKVRLRLEGLDCFKRAKKVLVYLSSPQEVDTHKLTQALLARGVEVFAPKITKEELSIAPFSHWDDLEPGSYGILEPKLAPLEQSAFNFDLILVPGLAFDERGHRLGYGKGYYDKLLKTVSGYTVGLAFSEQVLKELPTEAHDVPLDLIVTDSSLILLNPFTP